MSAKDSKADFIRSQPPTLSAREVVARGAKAGFDFSEHYVYVIRSADKRGGSRELREQFRKLALQLGLVEARRILDRLEKR